MQRTQVILDHIAGITNRTDRNISTDFVSNMEKGDDIVIVGACRTPMGSFNGVLASVSAVELGTVVISGALRRANLDPSAVEIVYMGNVLSANLGQAPARQAALGAKIPSSCVCTTVNKVCASGMKAIMLAAADIRLGYAKVAVAGGMESMSNAPYYLGKARGGYRMGNGELIDGMIKDGLWDPYNDCHMGIAAEKCAAKYSFSRQEQDRYAIQSCNRAIAALRSGAFKSEIEPVKINIRGKETIVIDDEEVSKLNPDKIPSLRPAFLPKDGTVTAGNASSISDGASAVVLTTRQYAREHSLNILGVLRGVGDAEQDPIEFTTAPALAIPKALKDANLTLEKVELVELNEAFAVVALANAKLLNIQEDILNIKGGGVSLGHPLGSSGCRIVVTLIHGLISNKTRYGCAAVCNGGGGASAVIIENESVK